MVVGVSSGIISLNPHDRELINKRAYASWPPKNADIDGEQISHVNCRSLGSKQVSCTSCQSERTDIVQTLCVPSLTRARDKG